EALEKIEATFDQWARDGKDLSMEEGHKNIVREVLQDVEVPFNGQVLDVGCGNGYVVRALANRLPDAAVMGIDISDSMLTRAKAATPENLYNAVYYRGTIFDESLNDEKFDLIFGMESLYYMAPVETAIKRLAEITNFGGQLIMVLDFYKENEASHEWPSKYGIEMELHSMDEYSAMFSAAGLENVEVKQVKDAKSDEAWKRDVGSLVVSGSRPAEMSADFLLGDI
ncbi:MAG: methyltransferase domain-containing protein, partial [Planctomycetes bacterium]|nr:methyltransferase domain-containing protein [Planctomycetota bacterium]